MKDAKEKILAELNRALNALAKTGNRALSHTVDKQDAAQARLLVSEAVKLVNALPDEAPAPKEVV